MSVAVPNLPSSDLAISEQFYVMKLGFTVIFRFSEDGHAGIVGLERDGMRINIDSPMDGHGRNACVSLEVDNVDLIFHEWSISLEGLRPPEDQPWGARTFDLQDPDNNTIFVLSSAG
jgi:catechol 2,3-dioxygenase-like lactoylglutathione lyase family enzyme